MEFLDKIVALLNSAQGQSVVIAMVLEFALRLIPSEKPLSIAHVIANAAKKIGNILVSIGNLLDKVLPQNLK